MKFTFNKLIHFPLLPTLVRTAVVGQENMPIGIVATARFSLSPRTTADIHSAYRFYCERKSIILCRKTHHPPQRTIASRRIMRCFLGHPENFCWQKHSSEAIFSNENECLFFCTKGPRFTLLFVLACFGATLTAAL